MACDLCGAKGTTLSDLVPKYRTDEVRQICPACERMANNQIWKIRAYQEGVLKTLVKRWLNNTKKESS